MSNGVPSEEQLASSNSPYVNYVLPSDAAYVSAANKANELESQRRAEQKKIELEQVLAGEPVTGSRSKYRKAGEIFTPIPRNKSNEGPVYAFPDARTEEPSLPNFVPMPRPESSSAPQAPSRMSLPDISDKYGQFSTFGHRDYQAAKQEGYSDEEIMNYLNADMSRLHADNQPGGSAGLYDEIKRGSVDLSKAVNIVR